MPRRDRKYMSDRREAIVDAALGLLLRDGVAGFSTPALCRAAGISTGALYTHFQSKNDVLLAVAERTAKARRADHDFHDRAEFRRNLARLADCALSDDEIAKIRADVELFLMGPSDTRILSVFRDFADCADLERDITRLVRVGELADTPDPAAAALAVNAMLIGLRMVALFGAKPGAPFAAAMHLLIDGLEQDRTRI